MGKQTFLVTVTNTTLMRVIVFDEDLGPDENTHREMAFAFAEDANNWPDRVEVRGAGVQYEALEVADV